MILPFSSIRLILTKATILLVLGGCIAGPGIDVNLAGRRSDDAPPTGYAALVSEPFPVEAVDTARIDPAYLRREIDYVTAEPVGTIVVDTAARYLYLVEPGGRARRYGVGVGAEGMTWSGVARVGAKQEWPDWYPTREMIARRPDIVGMLSPLRSGRGIAGGKANPVGARGLYLWRDGKDTLYRIHGTLEPYTIGQAVSSGCIRMVDQDVIDLYARVAIGTKVVVLPAGPGTGGTETAGGPSDGMGEAG
ncbi:L,D-transpeptidase [Methylobacterium sp. 10]|uniref:L,D-transpeptidase n=1 Tax=Methylobacterium sp. 10 TaxID=1101191 RepID=UPI0004B2691D|nr:L,D-transpeptidase [Methylobacterium sp. 10]